MERIKKLKLYNNTAYIEGKERNGGGYSYKREYILQNDGRYIVKYYCSANFDYCEVCGCFNCDGYMCKDVYVTEKSLNELIKEINELNNKDIWVEIE